MPLTLYTSLTYIWVLCLGCERANGGNAPIVHTSLTYICVLCLVCERANRVNAPIVEPLSPTFLDVSFVSYLSMFLFLCLLTPFALCAYCCFCVSAILPHALPGLHIPVDGHWQHDMRYPESFLTPVYTCLIALP